MRCERFRGDRECSREAAAARVAARPLHFAPAMIRSALFVLVCATACGSSNPPTPGSSSTGSGAIESGQTAGDTARSSRDSIADGDVYEGVTCDLSTDGLAWCDDDYTVAYCSDYTWWLVDCSAIGDVCAEFDDGTVDCWDGYY